MKISDYDEFDYDYRTYWKERIYEHRAEVLLLNKLFKKQKGTWFLDIGGSYGRLTPVYYTYFSHPVILDYSFKTLQKNKKILQQKFPKIELVAGNIYKIPFKSGVFEGALMNRVLHHIENPNKAIENVSQCLKPNSIYIQEIPNKIHIKAVIRELFKLNFKFLDQKPYLQPSKGNFEGSRSAESLFYNYHPKHIKKLMNRNQLIQLKTIGASYLRIGVLKKIIPINILLFLENIFQFLFTGLYIAPSIYLVAKKTTDSKAAQYSTLKDTLCCPLCRHNLTFKENTACCIKCNHKYLKINDIWDFRVK